jgi:hypothetical protein
MVVLSLQQVVVALALSAAMLLVIRVALVVLAQHHLFQALL